MFQKMVSVILPVYNCEMYIEECINSILNQTFGKFELIIVNDYSTDNTMEIINCFSDSRIKVYNNLDEKGISASLNKGISMAKGEFIARMDSDDICINDRLLRQVEYLEQNADVGVLGTGFREMGLQDKVIKLPSEHLDITIGLFGGAVLCHPSVMIRTELFKRFSYNCKYDSAEDYKLWVDLAIGGVRFHILKDALLLKRVHNKNISIIDRAKQRSISDLIRREYFNFKFNFLKEDEINSICINSGDNKKLNITEFNLVLSKIILLATNKPIARKMVLFIYRDLIYRVNPYFKFVDFLRLMMYKYPYKALKTKDIFRLFKRSIFVR